MLSLFIFTYPEDINFCHTFSGLFIRFGGRQIHASEDDGLINHATVRDLEEDAKRLEQFGEELEGE